MLRAISNALERKNPFYLSWIEGVDLVAGAGFEPATFRL